MEHAGTTLGDLLAGIDADLSEGAAEVRVHADVVVDSREVRDGTLFVAMSGALADGHDYLEAAARAGCAVAGLSVTRQGTAPSMPSRAETRALLETAS